MPSQMARVRRRRQTRRLRSRLTQSPIASMLPARCRAVRLRSGRVQSPVLSDAQHRLRQKVVKVRRQKPLKPKFGDRLMAGPQTLNLLI